MGRGGVTGALPRPHTPGLGRPRRPRVRPALATADPGCREGGAGAPVRERERRPPLPRPALLCGPAFGGGAAPQECQVRGRPTQGQRAWGRDQGPSRLCPRRSPRRACDLAGTTPCPEPARDRPRRSRCKGRLGRSRHPTRASHCAGERHRASSITPPTSPPRTDGLPGDSDSLLQIQYVTPRPLPSQIRGFSAE